MVPSVSPLRSRQLELVQAVVARVRGVDPSRSSPASWTLPDVQLSGLATGLTALATVVGVFEDAPPDVQTHLREQCRQVAARHHRFAALTPAVLAALADADIVAVPVKGAVLGGSAGGAPAWPDPATRPMSDIDLLVPARHRAQAAAVLERSGWAMHAANPHEDTFLAWGGGGVGRTDGESVDHNGRIEVHPGWVEFLHGYTVRGFDIERYAVAQQEGGVRLGEPALAAHVIGHLASTVVRAEVRAVNVLDVWFLHQRGLDWAAVASVMAAVDPRLTAPGLWLVDRLLPGVVPAAVLGAEMRRLPNGELLRRTETAAVLRDPGERTSARWRSAFATSGTERAAVVRQLGRSAAGRMRLRVAGRA